MATTLEKLSQNKAVEVKRMATDFENIRLSKDQHIAKYRKKKEIAAKLELEKQRLEELAEKEVKDLAAAGMQEQAPAAAQEE